MSRTFQIVCYILSLYMLVAGLYLCVGPLFNKTLVWHESLMFGVPMTALGILLFRLAYNGDFLARYSAQKEQEATSKISKATIKKASPDLAYSELASLAFFLSLFNVLILPVFFCGPASIILGIMGLYDIQRHPNKIGKGRAIFAVLFGGVATALMLAAIVTNSFSES